MMSENSSASPPRWFLAAALGVSGFYLLGCLAYLSQVTTDPAALAADQRAVWDAAPRWMLAANALAVWIGLAGAVMLLLRRRIADPLLLAAFVAVVAQFAALVIDPELRNLTTSDALFLPFVIILLAYGCWHLARVARKRGWLR
jgi:hypothetical protein